MFLLISIGVLVNCVRYLRLILVVFISLCIRVRMNRLFVSGVMLIYLFVIVL